MSSATSSPRAPSARTRGKGLGTAEVDRAWSELDPIFIVGRQRTGTSVVWRALRTAGFNGFAEGQLWLELVQPFCRLLDPQYAPDLRQQYFALSENRLEELEHRFALTIDGFQRRYVTPDTRRWVDKSPGPTAIRLSPMLARLFPKSQFIFTYRNPITTVMSAEEYVRRQNPDMRDALQGDAFFEATCGHWTRSMRSWRFARRLLGGRFFELAQEHLAAEPARIAQELMSFLDAPEATEAVSEIFGKRRENTAFPDRAAGDYSYSPNWGEEPQRLLTRICGDEAARWGYDLSFDHPSGPDLHLQVADSGPAPTFQEYCHWADLEGNERARELEAELRVVRGLIEQVASGKAMRVMNRSRELLRRMRRSSSAM